MRLLLDTNALIWWHQHKDRFGKHAMRFIEEASEIYVSVVSAWEIAVKTQLDKLNLIGAPGQVTETYEFTKLPLAFHHIENYRRLPPIHKDPFDRMLVLQAITEGLMLVSSDKMLARYPVSFVYACE